MGGSGPWDVVEGTLGGQVVPCPSVWKRFLGPAWGDPLPLAPGQAARVPCGLEWGVLVPGLALCSPAQSGAAPAEGLGGDRCISPCLVGSCEQRHMLCPSWGHGGQVLSGQGPEQPQTVAHGVSGALGCAVDPVRGPEGPRPGGGRWEPWGSRGSFLGRPGGCTAAPQEPTRRAVSRHRVRSCRAGRALPGASYGAARWAGGQRTPGASWQGSCPQQR